MRVELFDSDGCRLVLLDNFLDPGKDLTDSFLQRTVTTSPHDTCLDQVDTAGVGDDQAITGDIQSRVDTQDQLALAAGKLRFANHPCSLSC